MKRLGWLIPFLLLASPSFADTPDPYGRSIVRAVPGHSTPAYWVQAQDRIRVKIWNSAGTGQDEQVLLVVKFIRAGDDKGNVITARKVITPSNDRGSTAGQKAWSFPFGAAAAVGRSFATCNTTNGSGTVTCTGADFSGGTDIGKSVTISGAATASEAGGPSMPSTLLQANITAVASATSITVVPNALVTQNTNSATIKLEPVLLAEEDGNEFGDGWIVGIDMNFWQTAQKVGQTFAEVEINRGAWNMHQGITMIQNYVTYSHHIGWPYGEHRQMVDGPGWVHNITVSNPAAGANFTYAVPTNARMKILSGRFAMVTSSSVGNRRVCLTGNDGGSNYYFDSCAGADQAASATVVYGVGQNYTANAAPVNSRLLFPIPPLTLIEGYTLVTSVGGILAGDQLQAINFLVEEWIEE